MCEKLLSTILLAWMKGRSKNSTEHRGALSAHFRQKFCTFEASETIAKHMHLLAASLWSVMEVFVALNSLFGRWFLEDTCACSAVHKTRMTPSR